MASKDGYASVQARVDNVAAGFAAQRAERQKRRELDPADFAALAETGLLTASLPVAFGGLWQDGAHSGRALAELYRTLAHGDSSVALVASMHPTVLMVGQWLLVDPAPTPYAEAWQAQREWVFGTVHDGAWWGTITSEPGSGGDTAKTKTTARRDGEGYRMTGLKHFGSGTGVTSYMITEAVPAGEDEKDLFVLDMRHVNLDGSAGVKLVAPWDSHGMIATQSHMLQFEDFPAIRAACPQAVLGTTPLGWGAVCWAGIIAGIVEVAMATARQQLARRADWRPYEQVEWSRAEMEAWLIAQAYEGLLRDLDAGQTTQAVVGKTAIAELAEAALLRLCRVVGGGAYARYSPFGFWYEDVRALGFLRPPWGLAYDRMWETGRPGRA